MVLLHELEEEDEDAEARTSGAGSYRPAHLAPVRLECPGRRVSKGCRGGERKRNEQIGKAAELARALQQWSKSATSNVPISKALKYLKTCVFTSPVYSNFFTGLSNS